MSWTEKQEHILIDLLIEGLEHDGILIERTTKGKNKKHFADKSERAIKAKTKALYYEALLHDVDVTLPPPKPPEPKPTKQEIRAALFASKTKMTPQKRGSRIVQGELTIARQKRDQKKKAAEKAKATRDAKKETEQTEDAS